VVSNGRPASTTLPEAAVPDAVVEEVASEIASLVRGAELRCAFEVGRIVVERFYDGDQAAWHRKGPKTTSLARLAERLRDRGIGGAAALHLCLGVFETLTQLGEDSTWNLLTRSHVRAVLALPCPERVSLLRESQAREWTVAQLEAAASSKPRERRRGRMRASATARAIATAEDLFAPDGPAFSGLEGDSRPNPESIPDLHARVVRLKERLDLLQAHLSPKRLRALPSGADRRDRARSREA